MYLCVCVCVALSFLINFSTSLNQDDSTWRTVALAFQTLGVVYGDMGTSPLYVFSDVFSKVNIKSDVDVLGALSLVIYTIALIPLIKYVFIVLKANDSGEGISFLFKNLYSIGLFIGFIHIPNLICRRNICTIFIDLQVCKC